MDRILSKRSGEVLTNQPKYYRILFVLETMNYPISNNYPLTQMSKIS